jgi:hypothetical protein
VERRLAAAVGLDDLDVGAGRNVKLAGLGPTTERDRRRMLEEQHRVRQLAGGDRSGNGALQLERFRVRNETELRDVSLHGCS